MVHNVFLLHHSKNEPLNPHISLAQHQQVLNQQQQTHTAAVNEQRQCHSYKTQQVGLIHSHEIDLMPEMHSNESIDAYFSTDCCSGVIRTDSLHLGHSSSS